jgi:hypothetical protein
MMRALLTRLMLASPTLVIYVSFSNVINTCFSSLLFAGSSQISHNINSNFFVAQKDVDEGLAEKAKEQAEQSP